mmetsp:Transcript_12179/g.14523  ORF Transcript_12179/g.14523 Transcript_12179/m.14523 type:complete len:207 (-) Transcript_12179:887-1507(-)
MEGAVSAAVLGNHTPHHKLTSLSGGDVSASLAVSTGGENVLQISLQPGRHDAGTDERLRADEVLHGGVGHCDQCRGSVQRPGGDGVGGTDRVDGQALGRCVAAGGEVLLGGQDGTRLLAQALGSDKGHGGFGGAVTWGEVTAGAVVLTKVGVQDVADHVPGRADKLGVLVLGSDVADETNDTVVLQVGVILGGETGVLIEPVVGNE